MHMGKYTLLARKTERRWSVRHDWKCLRMDSGSGGWESTFGTHPGSRIVRGGSFFTGRQRNDSVHAQIIRFLRFPPE